LGGNVANVPNAVGGVYEVSVDQTVEEFKKHLIIELPTNTAVLPPADKEPAKNTSSSSSSSSSSGKH
jgi:hypothetical protein